MSKSVDQRVVEMRFDNQQFERNMATTMGSLEKLKRGLDLSGASKGLEEVEKAAGKCDMSGLSNAVETVKMRFSALEIMGITALTNITNSAVNAGKRILSALTIDPVKTGFSEYELKMGSIQTMMAATGEDLETVNGYLNELNEYSDKTIYSFSDMTQNIGKFTNAGVSLKDSVAAIQGISNVAAVSGANTNEASRAMYNFAQALSSGYVKLIDWKSIELANMGTVEFKNQLLESAAAAGTLKKSGDGLYKTLDGTVVSATKNFNDSLQDQWMTSEVLIGTLKKYSDENTEIGKKATKAATEVKTLSQLYDTLKESAQSGWAATWEIIVGDFEEAKEFMTELSDIFGTLIGKQAESRNELLENWKTLGGRTALLDSIRNIFDAIASVVKPISEAFREIFPPMTAERLMALTEGLKTFTAGLKLGDQTAENLKRTFKGVFAIFSIVKQAISAVFKAFGSLTGVAGDLGGGILGLTAKIGDWLVKLNDAIESSGIFNKVLKGVVNVVKAAAGGIKAFLGFVKEKIATPGFEALRSILEKVRDGMSSLGEVASIMKDGIISAFDAVGSFLEGCTLIKVLEAVWKGVMIIAAGIAKAFGALTKGLTNTLGGADFNGIIDILTSLVTGGIIIKVIQFLKNLISPLEEMKGFFGDLLGGITGMLDGVRGCLEGFQSKLKSDTLKSIAIAVGILAAALFVLSSIDSEALNRAIGVITIMFVELSTVLAVLNNMGAMKGIGSTARAMKNLAASMLILSVAMKILSTISWSEMGIALVGVAGGLTALVIAVNLLPEKKVKNAGSAIKKMATALLILSLALKLMGSMSWGELAVGLTAVLGSLALLVAAVNLLPKDTGLKVLGLVSFATALVILAGALKIMATMSWEELGLGLVALAGSLIIMVAALNLMSGAIPGALAMLIVAPALLILAGVLKILGTMSLDQVGVGLAAIGGALLILTVALTLMIAALPGAAALLVAAAALAVLAPVIILLGSVSWQTVVQGLLTLAGAFTIIGLAGLILGPIVPAILGLAGAITLIGIGTLAAGLGLMAFGAGLSALAIGFTAIVASLGAVVAGIIAIVSSIVTGVIKGIGDGIIALCQVITNGAPAICEALVAVIVALCDAIVASTPSIIEAIDVLLTALLAFIVDFVPRLVVAGMELIIGLLQGIAANIGGVISAAVDVVIAFIKGITSQIPKIIQTGVDLILDFINGMANSIRDNTPKLIDAVNNLMESVFEAIGAAIGNVPQLGKNIIQGLITGIKNSAGDLLNSMVGTVKGAWDGVKSFLGINSPSRLAAEAGMYVDEGFAGGLKKFAGTVGKEAVGVGKTAMDSLKESVGNISKIVESDIDAQPTIRPVLDLSDVEGGVRKLGGMLNIGSSVGVMANVGAISNGMSQRNQNGVGYTTTSNNTTNNTYIIDGVTYDDGSGVANAMEEIVHAAKVERRT